MCLHYIAFVYHDVSGSGSVHLQATIMEDDWLRVLCYQLLGTATHYVKC